MKRTSVYRLLLALVGLVAGNLSHAQEYMKAVASKQGAFQPGSPAPSPVGEGFMTVTDINFNEQVPAQTSAFQSKAVSHSPLKVTKPSDATSPKFLEAFLQGEKFNTVELKFASKDATGKFSVYMTLKLTDPYMSDFKQNGGSEVISWNYSKMEVIDESAASGSTPAVKPSMEMKPSTIKPVVTTLKKG